VSYPHPAPNSAPQGRAEPLTPRTTHPSSAVRRDSGVTLYANSICRHGPPDARYGFPIRHGRAPFSAETEAMAQAVDALPATNEWLYYPDKLGRALADAGIPSTIYAHSGRVYVDGIAQQ